MIGFRYGLLPLPLPQFATGVVQLLVRAGL